MATALIPADDIPAPTFSSLPTLRGDNKDDTRGDPKIVDGREDNDADELGVCNDPEDAAAAAAARKK